MLCNFVYWEREGGGGGQKILDKKKINYSVS